MVYGTTLAYLFKKMYFEVFSELLKINVNAKDCIKFHYLPCRQLAENRFLCIES